MAISKEMLERFQRPLEIDDCEWIIQFNSKDTSGKTKLLPYLTARTCYDRLREDIGVGNYQTDFRPIKIGGEEGALCVVKLKMLQEDGSSEWVQYVEGAESSNISSLKGSLSSAVKRTLSTLGLGRNLYDFAHVYIDGANLKSIPKWAYPKLKELTRQMLAGEATEFMYILREDQSSKTQQTTQTPSNNPIAKPATPSFIKK